MAILLHPDGTEEEVAPAGRYFTLTELYLRLSCSMVERVQLRDGRSMWMDEEAYLKHPIPPLNEKATQLYREAGGVPGWIIRGPVLIERGETQ